jgi:cysteinyl-tRNA synthetase
VTLDWSNEHAKRFRDAMEDDFDLPAALAVLHEMRREVNRSKSGDLAGLMKALAGTIGLLQDDARIFIQGSALSVKEFAAASDSAEAQVKNSRIDALVAERNAAKKAKDFSRADAIRKQLDASGIVLEDKPGGLTEWRRK